MPNKFQKKVRQIIIKANCNDVDLSPSEIFTYAAKIASFKTNPDSKVSKCEAQKYMSMLGL